MPAFNTCTLVGNLVRDPELKYTAQGKAIANFTIAVNKKWKTEAGENKEECSFFDCNCFGRTAEVISQHVKKGDPILVDGRLKQEQWEDKNTKAKRSRVVVIVETFQFLSIRQEAAQADAPRTSARTATPTAQERIKAVGDAEAPRPKEDDAFDEVPF